MSRPSVDPVKLSQIEIVVSDLGRSLRFYDEAFGWRPVPAEFHELVLLDVPRDCAFGISLRPEESASEGTGPQRLTLYFTVDDPEHVLDKVNAAGGKRIATTVKLPGYGVVYLCADPDGTRFGLFKRTPVAT